jgi:acylphosphatase
MKQVHLYISGFVQGVGYREFIKREARKIGLKGWVRNLSDRRVEVLAQGDEASLKKLIEISKKGPFLSEVKNVSIEQTEISEKFDTFDRLPTI